jgi:hydroxymethylglutaryl-CoA lyase
MPSFPASVVVRKVGLRDSLQSIATLLATECKKERLRDAHAAGRREIEVGSFVPARLLPRLADSAELLADAKTLPGMFVSVLAPSLITFMLADMRIATGIDIDKLLAPPAGLPGPFAWQARAARAAEPA